MKEIKDFYSLIGTGKGLVYLELSTKKSYDPTKYNYQELRSTIVEMIEMDFPYNLFIAHNWALTNEVEYLINRGGKIVHTENEYVFIKCPSIMGRMGLSDPKLGFDVHTTDYFDKEILIKITV